MAHLNIKIPICDKVDIIRAKEDKAPRSVYELQCSEQSRIYPAAVFAISSGKF